MEPKRKSPLDIILPLLGALIALWAALHLAAAHDAAALQAPDGTRPELGAVLAGFNERALESPFAIELTASSGQYAGIALAACLLIAAYAYGMRRKTIRGMEYGSARWATKDDIKSLQARNIAAKLIREAKRNRRLRRGEKKEKIREIKEKYADADMILTATERASIYNFEINNNHLIIGGSGSGKTRGYVMPNILQAHSSYIITDPKGEILEKSGKFLEGRGYRIRALNLAEKHLSNGFNPFAYIHMERDGWEERVLTLIETIILNTDGDKAGGGSDPFWDKAERLFLQALFFFTAQSCAEEDRNMNTVMELISWLELPEEEDERDSKLDAFAEVFAEIYGADHIGARQYNEFRSKASGKTAKSIVISAVARLAPFQVAEVKRIFSHDQMALDRVGEEKTAIFVIVPPIDKTYNFIAGILFTQLFQELNHCALEVHKHDGQRLPVPCRFILDEFANTCRIPNFIEILAYARSLGIGISVILQSLDQIKKIYEKDWGVLIDNCNALLYLGAVTQMDTLEYISKLAGKGTFDKQNLSQQKTGRGGSSQTTDSLGRELLLPDEIRVMRKKKCILIIGGVHPFYSDKFDYKTHKRYGLTSDASRENSYRFEPPPRPPARAGAEARAGETTSKGIEERIAALLPDFRPAAIEPHPAAALLETLRGGMAGVSFAEFGNAGDDEAALALPYGDLLEYFVDAAFIELDPSPAGLIETIEAARSDPGSVSFAGGNGGDGEDDEDWPLEDSGEIPEDFQEKLFSLDLSEIPVA